MEGAVCISKEGPKKLNLVVSEEESIPGIVCLEEGSGGTSKKCLESLWVNGQPYPAKFLETSLS